MIKKYKEKFRKKKEKAQLFSKGRPKRSRQPQVSPYAISQIPHGRRERASLHGVYWETGNGGGDELELGHLAHAFPLPPAPRLPANIPPPPPPLPDTTSSSARRLRGSGLSPSSFPLGFSPIPNHCKSPPLAWVSPLELGLT